MCPNINGFDNFYIKQNMISQLNMSSINLINAEYDALYVLNKGKYNNKIILAD